MPSVRPPAPAPSPPSAPSAPVRVSTISFASKDPDVIVQSNVSVVNAMFAADYPIEQISREALTSYYVDYYVVQVQNGGLAQFVFNSRASALVFELVDEGLGAIGATRHRALFAGLLSRVVKLGRKKIEEFFASQYFGKNATRDVLNETTDAFYELSKQENITELNARWLRQLPNLKVLPRAKIEEEIATGAPGAKTKKASLRPPPATAAKRSKPTKEAKKKVAAKPTKPTGAAKPAKTTKTTKKTTAKKTGAKKKPAAKRTRR
jgi:hypothetical protein